MQIRLGRVASELLVVVLGASCAVAQNNFKRVVAWDGVQAAIGSGWVNPTTSTLKPQSVERHGGKPALEFRFKGDYTWVGAGWNWFNFKTGTEIGTDASAMKNLSFWIKATGKMGDLQINMLSNGVVLDTMEEHSQRVHVVKYCPLWLDGNWHEVVIPMSDLEKSGFNTKIISEIHLNLESPAAVGMDGSLFISEIAFDDRD